MCDSTFIEVEFTHHMISSCTSRGVQLSTYRHQSAHHFCLVLEHSTTRKETPSPLAVTPQRDTHKSTFCLWICLFWAFPSHGVTHPVALCVWRLSPSAVCWGPSVLWHMSGLPSFSSLCNIPHVVAPSRREEPRPVPGHLHLPAPPPGTARMPVSGQQTEGRSPAAGLGPGQPSFLGGI